MKKKWTRAVLAVACVLCALMMVQMLAGAQGPCSLTVHPYNDTTIKDEEMEADLMGPAADGSTRLGFDLYKVAGMVRSQTVDSYEYVPVADFPDIVIADDITTAGWQEIAQKAAEKIFLDEKGQVRGDPGMEPALENVPMNQKKPDLEPGLYLVVAHERDVGHGEYLDTTKDGKLVTRFKGEKKQYLFLPELITLPTKDAVDGEVNTANPGPWKEDVAIYLKPEVDDVTGPIRIVKNLLSYGSDSPVTFVFRVQAFDGDKMVYEKVVSMDFTEAGTKSITLDGLPVGAVVTVEEIYSGANCKFVRRVDPEEPVVQLEVPIEFTFVNDFDNTNKGHGILNRFVFVEGEDGGRGHWVVNPEAEGGEAP